MAWFTNPITNKKTTVDTVHHLTSAIDPKTKKVVKKYEVYMSDGSRYETWNDQDNNVAKSMKAYLAQNKYKKVW